MQLPAPSSSLWSLESVSAHTRKCHRNKMCPYWYRNFSPQAQDKLRNLPALEKLGLQFVFKIEAACALTHLIMAICSLLFWIGWGPSWFAFQNSSESASSKDWRSYQKGHGVGRMCQLMLSLSFWVIAFMKQKKKWKVKLINIKARKRKQGWNLSWLSRSHSFKIMTLRTFLAVRWLRLPLPLGSGGWGDAGSIPGGDLRPHKRCVAANK